MASVYLLNITGSMDELSCKTKFPARYEKAGRFRFEEDRRRCIGVGILLSDILGLTECDIRIGTYGKPYSARIPEKFSISHSGDYCILAVSRNAIGVDIEKINSAHLSVADRIFDDTELAYMKRDPLRNFFALWTMKESVSKVCGKGMAMPFDSFCTVPLLNGASVCVENTLLYGQNLSPDGYSLSVCTANRPDTAECIFVN